MGDVVAETTREEIAEVGRAAVFLDVLLETLPVDFESPWFWWVIGVHNDVETAAVVVDLR